MSERIATQRWYRLQTGYPQKIFGKVLVTVEKENALAYDGPDHYSSIVAQMERVRLEMMAADFLLLSGMELLGVKANGEKKYRFQTWHLFYVAKDDQPDLKRRQRT